MAHPCAKSLSVRAGLLGVSLFLLITLTGAGCIQSNPPPANTAASGQPGIGPVEVAAADSLWQMSLPAGFSVKQRPAAVPGLDNLAHSASRIDKFTACDGACDRYSTVTVYAIFGFDTEAVDQVLAPQIQALTRLAASGDNTDASQVARWEHTPADQTQYLLINGDLALDDSLIAATRVGRSIVYVAGPDRATAEEVLDAAVRTLRVQSR